MFLCLLHSREFIRQILCECIYQDLARGPNVLQKASHRPGQWNKTAGRTNQYDNRYTLLDRPVQRPLEVV